MGRMERRRRFRTDGTVPRLMALSEPYGVRLRLKPDWRPSQPTAKGCRVFQRENDSCEPSRVVCHTTCRPKKDLGLSFGISLTECGRPV